MWLESFLNRASFTWLTLKSLCWQPRTRYFKGQRTRSALGEFRQKEKLSVAIFHQGGIGSGLLLGPMLQVLRSFKPKANIDLFSWQKEEGEFFKEAGFLSNFYVVQRKGGLSLSKNSYDLLLSAARTYEGDRVVRKIPAKFKIGFEHSVGWHRRSFLYQNAAIPLSWQEHEAQANVALLAPLMGKMPEVPSNILAKESSFLEGFENRRNDRKMLFVLHPGSGGGLSWKRLDLAKIVELVKLLLENFSCKITLFAGPSEREEVRQLKANLGEKVSVFEVIGSLADSFRFLKTVDCLITHDSAVMHLGAAAKRPLVAIFGPTNPSLCGPWCDENLFRIVRLPLPCSPCYRFYSGALNCVNSDFLACLRYLSAREIVDAVRSLLEPGNK